MGSEGHFKDSFERKAQSDTAVAHSLHMMFAYVVDHQHMIDDTLVPPFEDIELLHQNLEENGLDAFDAQDGETILHMASGLEGLSAKNVSGYYNEKDFERVTIFADRLRQKGWGHKI